MQPNLSLNCARFKPCNYDQDSQVVINFRAQRQPGTFEYARHYLIEHKLGLPVFGNITVNQGLNRFSLRGQKKCRVSGSFTAWFTISRNWRIMVAWRGDRWLASSLSRGG